MIVLVRPEAKHDILEAAQWYEERRQGLGAEFVRAVDIVLGCIEERPERFLKAYRGLRRALVTRFPYAVYFAIMPTSALVLAVIHQRRDLKLLDARID